MTGKMYEAVVIGASAGALEALFEILPQLPQGFPLPIMVVVHLPPDKKSIMAELLQSRCALQVREAEDKEPLRRGTIYFAPPDYHLLVETDRHLSLSSDEPVLFSRPSIDVLFESAADVFEDKLLAVVLTGANNDGARGLKMVSEAGGTAVVQHPETAYAAAMPSAALKACPHAQLASLQEIAGILKQSAMVS